MKNEDGSNLGECKLQITIITVQTWTTATEQTTDEQNGGGGICIFTQMEIGNYFAQRKISNLYVKLWEINKNMPWTRR